MTKKQAMPYMKLYTSYLDDIRLNRLAEGTRWRYMQVYLLAFKADSSGELIDPETGDSLTAEDIAMLLRADETEVSNDLAALVSTRLLAQNGETWRVTRYCDEQVNQAEYRKATAERVAKHRGKQSQPKESQANESELKESELNIQSSVKSSKVKSNNDVTRYQQVTQNDDDASLSKAKEPDHPELAQLEEKWRNYMKAPISDITKSVINQRLRDGISSDEIHQKIVATGNGCDNPSGRDNYFSKSVGELNPPPAQPRSRLLP